MKPVPRRAKGWGWTRNGRFEVTRERANAPKCRGCIVAAAPVATQFTYGHPADVTVAPAGVPEEVYFRGSVELSLLITSIWTLLTTARVCVHGVMLIVVAAAILHDRDPI